MIIEITKKQHKEMLEELIKFTKKNQTLMWNYMIVIKQIRREPEEKLMLKRLKKQAKDYQLKKEQ